MAGGSQKEEAYHQGTLIDKLAQIVLLMNTTEESEDSVFREIDSEDEGSGVIEIARRWPKQTLYILGNEFCERFCYYGMRAVLTLYLMTILTLSSDAATALYHGL